MTRRDGDWLAGARRIVALAPPPRRLAQLRYALGKHHDDLGDYAEAFANFEQANALSKLCRPPHDRAALSARVDELMRACDAGWLAAAQGLGDPSARPVFVVGMLRSGTTLLEQMLASHPDAEGAGELSFWGEAAARSWAPAGQAPSIRAAWRRTIWPCSARRTGWSTRCPATSCTWA